MSESFSRPDVGLIAVSTLGVTDRREQRRRARDLIETWTSDPWPPGLLSLACFESSGEGTEPGLLAGAEHAGRNRTEVHHDVVQRRRYRVAAVGELCEGDTRVQDPGLLVLPRHR